MIIAKVSGGGRVASLKHDTLRTTKLLLVPTGGCQRATPSGGALFGSETWSAQVKR